jgi:hypothetical protein
MLSSSPDLIRRSFRSRAIRQDAAMPGHETPRFAAHLRVVMGIAVAAVALSSSAAAEVCDKVAGDGWMPPDGAVFLVTQPLGALVLATMTICLGVVLRLRLRIIGTLLTAVAALAAYAMYERLLWNDDVMHYALGEGCLSTLSLTVDFVMTTLLAVAYGAALFWLWSTHDWSSDRRQES